MISKLQLPPEAMGVGMTSQRVRDRLIERLRNAGIRDERVLTAMRMVPRHIFVDEVLASRSYDDTALPIGQGQTISQPWVVATMTEAVLSGGPRKKVLEIGTGSGYQAAILAALGLEVYTVERIGKLLRRARRQFRQLGLQLRSKHDDGNLGWAEHAPYDAVIVTAAAPAVIDRLVQQLAVGGRLIAPIGTDDGQQLICVDRREDERIERTALGNVVFVPLLAGTLD